MGDAGPVVAIASTEGETARDAFSDVVIGKDGDVSVGLGDDARRRERLAEHGGGKLQAAARSEDADVTAALRADITCLSVDAAGAEQRNIPGRIIGLSS